MQIKNCGYMESVICKSTVTRLYLAKDCCRLQASEIHLNEKLKFNSEPSERGRTKCAAFVWKRT
uniref:Uncharacterized protein n=1 Tax=Anguilla anguilla TaxID=7936 RepID=A0A0E9QR66_ANGAN